MHYIKNKVNHNLMYTATKVQHHSNSVADPCSTFQIMSDLRPCVTIGLADAVTAEWHLDFLYAAFVLQSQVQRWCIELQLHAQNHNRVQSQLRSRRLSPYQAGLLAHLQSKENHSANAQRTTLWGNIGLWQEDQHKRNHSHFITCTTDTGYYGKRAKVGGAVSGSTEITGRR